MKKDNRKFVIADADGAEALYIDGKFWGYNDPLTPDDLAAAIGINFRRDEISTEWLEKGEEFPENLDDIEFVNIK